MRLATRRSPLALIQAEKVKAAISTQFPERQVDIVPVDTSGDKDTQSLLSEIGGKNVFIREIEETLLDQKADIAVHSFKDITSALASGLRLSGFLRPESQHDCMVSWGNKPLNALPQGARIGTGARRRQALIKKIRPDIECVPIRGNVQTRIDAIVEKKLHGVILSHAGLIRLGLETQVSDMFPLTDFVPAPGQGVIALQTRENDSESHVIAEALSDFKQLQISQLEFTFLKEIGLGCNAPLGLYSSVIGEYLEMTLFLADDNLTPLVHETRSFNLSHAIPDIQGWARELKTVYEGANT